jgi:hypothetical protein
VKRRQVLAGAAGLLSLTAGCQTGSSPESAPTSTGTTATSTTTSGTSATETTRATRTTVEPTVDTLAETPPEVEADCGDDLPPVEFADGESYPSAADGVELTVSDDTVAIGDDVTFALKHIGERELELGQKYQYNILRASDGGDWEPVYRIAELTTWTALGIRVAPGGGYEWPFTFTRDGLERKNGKANPPYVVCSPLEPGTYRFAFFGMVDDETLAVEFEVTES